MSKPALRPPSLLFNGTKTLSEVVNRPGHKDDHSLLPGTEINNTWRCTSTPSICRHGVYRENFYRLHTHTHTQIHRRYLMKPKTETDIPTKLRFSHSTSVSPDKYLNSTSGRPQPLLSRFFPFIISHPTLRNYTILRRCERCAVSHKWYRCTVASRGSLTAALQWRPCRLFLRDSWHNRNLTF